VSSIFRIGPASPRMIAADAWLERNGAALTAALTAP
jgi:hypothetical protein